ncbi:MAG: hypothetical protein WBG10_19565 [Pseudolabrys sp.]
MRRIALATAATLAILAGGSFVPNRADAMTITTPAGIRTSLDGTTLAQDVAYVCRRVWRCGPYGCGWRRGCWRTGDGPYYHGGPYRRRYWW